MAKPLTFYLNQVEFQWVSSAIKSALVESKLYSFKVIHKANFAGM